MANIKFYLGSPKKDVSLVFISVYCNDGRIRLSTGETVHTQYWNVAKQRATIKGYSSGIGTNSVLNSIQTNFDERSNILKATKQVLTKAIVESVLTHTRNQTDPDHGTEQPLTFWKYFDEFLSRDRFTKDGLPIKPQSYTAYKLTYQRLKDFEKAKKIKLDFGSMDKMMLEKFVSYLYKKPNKNYSDGGRVGLSPNTVGLTIKRLKTVLNEAIESGHSVPPNFRKVGAPQVETTEIALNNDELMQLYGFDFSHNKGYEQVRDLFIVGCFTSLRWSDYSKISDKNIKQQITGKGKAERVLSVTTEKTGQTVDIPITQIVDTILEKYNGTLPKPHTNQIMNRYLKEICKLVGFTSIVKVTEYDQGQRKDTNYEKWELVCSHTARRTGVTMIYNLTKDIVLGMSLTGHKTESQFRKYIRNDSITNAQTLNDAFVSSGFGNITTPKKNHLSIVSKAV